MGEWLLHTICRQLQHWHKAGYTWLRVAVNLSIRQLQEPNLPARINEILTETGLTADALELEITESVAMQNIDFSLNILSELSAMGLHHSIDDFGTGYSSLDRLKRLPIRALKVDQSFIRDLTSNTDDAAIVNAIIAMAHSLNLTVVAEGVETEEQLAQLRAQGCDEIQGHLFSQAIPAEALTTLLQKGQRLWP